MRRPFVSVVVLASSFSCSPGASDSDSNSSFSGGTGPDSATEASVGDGSTAMVPTTTSPSTSSASAGQTTADTDSTTSDLETSTTDDTDDTAVASECTPGANEACYSGPEASEGVGPCAAGMRWCDVAGVWGPCTGEVTPVDEVCGNQIDDNCDGTVDEDPDADGDGFTVCGGDCCDVVGEVCQNPELVNPGAYEVVGNQVDDNCDGAVDEPTPLCDDNLASNSADGLDYARALDLCQFTVESPQQPQDKIWGVISAGFSLANGMGTPVAVQRAIRPGFGTNIDVLQGQRLAVLSSGHAAAPGDVNPPYASFQSGVNHKTSSPPPAEWFAANNGKLPNPMGCQAPAQVTSNDPIMLTLRLRAPTNAKSFSVKMFFFSAEYPEWVCSQYNDFFVALLDSKAANNPSDTNIAVYDDGQDRWPMGVNLVKVVSGLFGACQSGIVGCASNNIPESQYNGCTDATLLHGTGFDELDNGGCGAGKFVGGGTGWLTMTGNVEPGEVFTVKLAVWDSGGHIFDSLVLLDDWQWSLDATEPGIAPQ